MLSSNDDWYEINNRFMVTETTLLILNDTLFPLIFQSLSFVPDYMRIIASNRLANSAPDWVYWMSFISSGAYYSAWMIVDAELAK